MSFLDRIIEEYFSSAEYMKDYEALEDESYHKAYKDYSDLIDKFHAEYSREKAERIYNEILTFLCVSENINFKLGFNFAVRLMEAINKIK